MASCNSFKMYEHNLSFYTFFKCPASARRFSKIAASINRCYGTFLWACSTLR